MTEAIAKQFSLIKKAQLRDDGSVEIEGWVSTNEEDLDKDILEPEAFGGAVLKGYFERGAPMSTEHNTKDYPVGYMVKAALVRDGVIFQEEDNPRYDPTSFAYFDGTGTGWYGKAVIDDERAAQQVAKGKLSSFSWIGLPKAWTPRPGGGRHYKEAGINPLMEATVTAYPVNPTAVMRIAKAHMKETPMADEPTKNPELPTDLLEQLLNGAAQKAAAQETARLEAKGTVTREQFSTALNEFQSQLLDGVKEQIAKALEASTPPTDPEPELVGKGRKGTMQQSDSADPREANPVRYLIQKSRAEEGKGFEKFDPTDKALVWELTKKALTQGMSNAALDEDQN